MCKAKTFVTLMLLAGAAPAFGGIFTSGNLVVLRVGDGNTALSSAAQATFLDEYTPGGVLVQSVPMPTTVSGANRRVTMNGTAASEGQLGRSTDGRYLTFAGYDADVGTAAINSTTSAAVNRVVARVDFNSIVDSSTAISDAFSANNPRGVATEDGSQYWVTGSNSGVRNIAHAGGVTTQIATAPTNIRNVNIQNGQLYISSGSGGFSGISEVGSGAPNTSGQTTTLLPGFASVSGLSIYDFTFVGANTLYCADDSAGNLGLQKWTFDGTQWSKQYQITAGLPVNGRVRQFTSTTDAFGNTVIYATSQNGTNTGNTTGYSLVSLVDTGAGSSFNVVATVGAATAFRGIEWAPIPAPSVGTLLGLGSLLVARRRR